jgi:hypothetical protein
MTKDQKGLWTGSLIGATLSIIVVYYINKLSLNPLSYLNLVLLYIGDVVFAVLVGTLLLKLINMFMTRKGRYNN